MITSGVRLFEAILAPTGERIILKEYLPIMRNLAASEIEYVLAAIKKPLHTNIHHDGRAHLI
jgi:hypothetical protein